jgi:H+/Cl- antiporter ClcA
VLATPFRNPFSNPATHERLVRFFGVRLRMVVLIVAVGLAGGAIGATYTRALELVVDVFGPGEWANWPHVITKTPFGSALVVTEMTGLALLPTTLVSSLTALVLTSPVGLMDNQRRRIDAYEHGPA